MFPSRVRERAPWTTTWLLGTSICCPSGVWAYWSTEVPCWLPPEFTMVTACRPWMPSEPGVASWIVPLADIATRSVKQEAEEQGWLKTTVWCFWASSVSMVDTGSYCTGRCWSGRWKLRVQWHLWKLDCCFCPQRVSPLQTKVRLGFFYTFRRVILVSINRKVLFCVWAFLVVFTCTRAVLLVSLWFSELLPRCPMSPESLRCLIQQP